MLKLGVKQIPGTSRIHSISQKGITDELSYRDLIIVQLQDDILELQERQTNFVDYWDVLPSDPQEEQVMYITDYQELSIYFNGEWLIIPPSSLSIYINRDTNVQYAWSGSAMVVMTVPLTKPGIENLIYVGKKTLLSNETALDLAAFDVFDRFTNPLTGATAFTIANPKAYKPFRIKLKGGSIGEQPFTGYTATWALYALNTDYDAVNGNWLNCEIRDDATINLFWGE